VLDQVDVDLNGRTEQSLALIGDTLEIRGAPEIEEWKKLSTVWQDQPPDDRIHLFVKLPASGERKILLRMEHHLENSPFFMYAPASCSLVNSSMRFSINIIPIDEGKTCPQVTTEVRALARILDLQHHIFRVLQGEMFIGCGLHSPLYILPMQNMLTLDDLKQQDLTVLRNDAMPLHNLPRNTVSLFFSAQDLDRIHFLVWLPSENGKFFGKIYSGQYLPDPTAQERFLPNPALYYLKAFESISALDFESISKHSRSQDSGSQGRSPNFKNDVKTFYGLSGDGDLFDMATGKKLRHGCVIGTHIFQLCWQTSLSIVSSFTDINHVRNALLLYKPVEDAFDRARLCIDVKGQTMWFRLLDEMLQATKLTDRAVVLRKAAKLQILLTAAEMALTTTFGDLDGRELFFPRGCIQRPSKQLLALHGCAALLFARANYEVPVTSVPDLDQDMSVSDDLQTQVTLKHFK
jgi:hypothetical protein